MHIQFADGRAVRPGRPLRTKTLLRRYAEYGCAIVARMAKSHRPCCDDWAAIDRRNRHGSVVDDAVDNEISYVGLNRDNVACDIGNFPGELFLSRKLRFGWMDFYRMDLHFSLIDNSFPICCPRICNPIHQTP